MAESKVKKGFFFYLMIFLIIVLAFIGVCITLMVFNPGKSVLGFKYYSNNETYEITKTTDSNTELNLSTTNYSEINIDAGIANVTFEANQDYDKDCIVVHNNAKGVAKASENTGFGYTVKAKDGVLDISVTAGKGFLAFSNDISVIVHIAKRSNDVTFFSNTNLNVKTTSGNVVLGGEVKNGANNICIGGINVETDSGDIRFTKHLNGGDNNGLDKYQYTKDIKLLTKKGTINLVENNSTVTTKEGNNEVKVTKYLNVISPAVLDINVGSGTLKLGNAKANTKLTADGATVEATSLSGDLEVSLRSVIFNVGTINGDLDFSKGNSVMDGNRITVDKVTGIVNVPDGKSSMISISEIGGQSIIHTTTGNVIVGTSKTPITKLCQIQTNSGNITSYFDGSAVSRNIKSEQGNITVNYVNALTSGDKNNIYNNTGKININFNKDSKIRFYFDKVEAKEDEEFDMSKVSFDILNGRTLQSNPYLYETTEGSGAAVYVTTNKSVTLDLI